jgi:S-adenosylmethionine:diacylglycerol 3-amino-3-carboxypropyl transferase
MDKAVEKSSNEIRSKAYESAVINLSANLPLPSSFYQNHHYRIHYNDMLPKHTQFQNEYIYAFTWEDPRVDHRLLNIGSDDVILAITSAGDNILDYLTKKPSPCSRCRPQPEPEPSSRAEGGQLHRTGIS